MRESIEPSQREFARKLTKSGHEMSYTKVRDIEEKKRSIWIDATRSDGAISVMLQTIADEEEIDLMNASQETIRLFKMALTLPEKRELLHAVLVALLASEIRSEKARK